jgi:hypothetical protein
MQSRPTEPDIAESKSLRGSAGRLLDGATYRPPAKRIFQLRDETAQASGLFQQERRRGQCFRSFCGLTGKSNNESQAVLPLPGPGVPREPVPINSGYVAGNHGTMVCRTNHALRARRPEHPRSRNAFMAGALITGMESLMLN